MRASTSLLVVAVAVLAALSFAQQYPGCRTDAQCQTTGDKGAYCNQQSGYCHCSFPVYNNTFWGYCIKRECTSNADCTAGGDASATCNTATGNCACSSPYQNDPSGAFCNIDVCTDATCRADGDSGSYCKSSGTCRCDLPYANYPTGAFCRIPPWAPTQEQQQ